ncbi:phosphonopyruvate decarboxylase [Phenylobacterium sp.]|uniref:phosphonopyruvate decarboxylase n=1 Tax=Phenylobacterium sp. TaxID=1871053 RepID=UPI002E354E7F|nr:phosphonopyruvate decarboxylase [Phenylobacterium sp.]HEX4712222.1 phosphonopyruvate decarboxylase [Phenylobacterium sp.]
MIAAQSFCDTAKLAGFSLYTGVPCSYVKPFINFVIDAPDLTYIGAANEGDAVAIATGAGLAGTRAIVMMQNSGLGNAVSPLTSLNAVFRIPILLIVTLRGEPGGPHDEPQHELMGAITTTMLETINVAWDWFPTEESQVGASIEKALSHMTTTDLPFCLVMRKNSVAPHELTSTPAVRRAANGGAATPAAPVAGDVRVVAATPTDRSERPSRADALQAIQRAVAPEDIVIATTGYTGRELYACDDRPNQLYVVGSMGCASSIGLGMAWARPDRRVVVIDGDGAMLMRLGALATLAYERPANLVHVLLDNEAHESTGGQSTVSHSMDLAGVAVSCGYPSVARIAASEELETLLKDRTPGLRFISLKTRHGVPADLPRPTVTPREVARRITKTLQRTA